jgi:hypothetical protein
MIVDSLCNHRCGWWGPLVGLAGMGLIGMWTAHRDYAQLDYDELAGGDR